MRSTLLSCVMAVAIVSVLGTARAQSIPLTDGFSGPTLDTGKWQVQAYPKHTKGSFGRTPNFITDTSVTPNVAAARFAVQIFDDPDAGLDFTSIASKQKFTPPSAGQYLQFSTKVKVNWSSARTPGLVFGISAYGRDPNQGPEDAVNFEFVTEDINVGGGTAYDRVLLSSYDEYHGSTTGRWYESVQSGVNATDGYHVYTMRLFPNKVEFQIDNTILRTITSVVPNGDDLSFVLNAWAPDTRWSSAEAPLPPNSFWYMDVDWATVSYGSTVPAPEPGVTALLLPAAALMLRRRR